MERTGIVLAIVVALSWGMADTVATLATRRQGTFVTTVISLMASVAVLCLFESVAFAQLSLSPMVFVRSASLGLLTGILAAVGYYSLYKGLGKVQIRYILLDSLNDPSCQKLIPKWLLERLQN